MRVSRFTLLLGAAFFIFTTIIPMEAAALNQPSTPDVQPPAWIYDAVIYQIFPRVHSDEGSLRAVAESLASIRQLGVNTLYLMPIHEIGEVRRVGKEGSPYSVRDHLSVHPNLGTLEDLVDLVDQAHALGMRVIMDLVPNHTAFDHLLVKAHPDWYRRDSHGNPLPPNPEWQDVAQLDFAVPEVRDYITNVALYWLENAGIDGFRVDASVYVPMSFWREFYPAIKAAHPQAFLLSESGESWLMQAFDAQYDWEFERLLGRVFQGESAQLLVHHLLSERSSSLKVRYLENHDHPRWLSRFAPHTTVPAALLLVTAPGIPFIYAGQEYGATHRPSLFDPDRMTTPGNLEVYRVYQELLALREASPELRKGGFQPLATGDAHRTIAYVRAEPQADQALLVVANLGAGLSTSELHLGTWLVDQLVWQGGGAEIRCADSGCTAMLPGLSGAIYRVRQAQ